MRTGNHPAHPGAGHPGAGQGTARGAAGTRPRGWRCESGGNGPAGRAPILLDTCALVFDALENGEAEGSLACAGISLLEHGRFAADTPFTPWRHSRANTRSGGAPWKRLCCRRSKSWGSASFPITRRGPGISQGKDRRNHDLPQHRLPQLPASFRSGSTESEPGHYPSAWRNHRTKERHPRV